MKKEYDFSKAKCGAGALASNGAVVDVAERHGKTKISIRIDADILEWFRLRAEARGGGNYQSDINKALREYITGFSEIVAQSRAVHATVEALRADLYAMQDMMTAREKARLEIVKRRHAKSATKTRV